MPSPLSPPFLAALVAAALFETGRRRQLRVVAPARRRALAWRAGAFWAGLAALVLALDSVVDDEADRFFWVHMSQHVLLMMVAAPLLVLSAPWTTLWKGLPLRARRPLAAGYVHAPAWRALRTAGRRIGQPLPVWLLFAADLAAWHVPALYGLTLRSRSVHDLEHVSFLVLAVLFWIQVLDSPPLRARLDRPRGVAFVVLGATACWLLAVVLAFAPSALYAGYLTARSHHGGLSALSDQHLAAGVMWGPGSVPYAVYVFVALYRWLAPAREDPPRLTPARPRLRGPRPPAAPGRSGAGPAARAGRS